MKKLKIYLDQTTKKTREIPGIGTFRLLQFYAFPAKLFFKKLSVSRFASYDTVNVLHELQRVTVDK